MSERIIRLEACRGLAALVVVFYHTIFAFEPTLSGALADTRTAQSLVGTVLFVFINGPAAVIFFFVLSGYVLTSRFFRSPNPDYIVVAALKRLPRLALLTTIATFSSALIWLCSLYYFREASEITGSAWLNSFAFADLPDNFQPSLLGALAQGAWRTFLVGDSYYNISLWTMIYEFHGSIVVFIAAPFIVFVLRNRLTWLFFVVAALTSRYAAPYMIPFICGMGIAYYQRTLFAFASSLTTAILLAIGIYFLGFEVAVKHYALFAKLIFWHPAPASSVELKILVQTIGAACIIIAVLQSPIAERVLDNRFGALLGRLSFPVYLVHVPIIMSASSAVYISLFSFIGKNAIWGAAASTLILTLIVSWPLASIDAAWVRFLNTKIGALVDRANSIWNTGRGRVLDQAASALGQKQAQKHRLATSAVNPKADVG